MDLTDHIWKNHLGRAGFSANIPWYEEEKTIPPLIPSSCVMLDSLPSTVPSLIYGGVVALQNDGNLYNSSGTKVEESGGGVVQCRMRKQLEAIETYNIIQNEMAYYYVYTNDELKRAVRENGVVVEQLQSSENNIELSEADYVFTNGCIVFAEAVFSASERFFVSFYEYVGKLGVPSSNATAPTTPTTSTTFTTSIVSTDEIPEGVVHGFFTRERFLDALNSITTDDIAKGQKAQNDERIRREELSQQNARIESVTTEISETNVGLLELRDDMQTLDEITHDRISNAIENTSLATFIEDEGSLHFNQQAFSRQLAAKTTDDIVEGLQHHFFKPSTLLSISQTLPQTWTSDDIREGTQNHYFKTERVLAVTQPIVQDAIEQFEIKLSVGALASVADTLASMQATATSTLATAESAQTAVHRTDQRLSTLANSIPIFTTDLSESPEALFFSEERVAQSESILSIAARIEDVRLTGTTTFSNLIAEQTLADINPSPDHHLFTNNEFVALHSYLSTQTTDNLLEGTSNLFFTPERARTAVATQIDERARAIVDNRTYTLDDIADGDDRKLLKATDVTASISDAVNSVTTQIENLENAAAHNRQITAQKIAEVVSSTSVCHSQTEIIHSQLSAYQSELSVCKSRISVSSSQNSDCQSELAQQNEKISTLESLINNVETHAVQNSNDFQQFVTALNTDTILEGEVNRFFTEERAQQAVTPLLTTENILESDAALFFTNERCISAVQTSDITSRITSVEERASTLTTTFELGLSASSARISDQAIAITDTQASIEEITNVVSTLTTENIIETPSALYFTSERSLSVNRLVYDRVSRLEGLTRGTPSDDRLKFDEHPLSSALSVVGALHPVSYTMTLSLGQSVSEGFDDVGFIAQDVLSIQELSHAVVEGDENTPFLLDYHSITTFAVAAIQELQLSVQTITNEALSLASSALPQANFGHEFQQAVLGVNTDQIAPTPSRQFAFAGNTQAFGRISLEEFRFLLHQTNSDDIQQGTKNLYVSPTPEAVAITDTSQVAESTNLYFTDQRCDNRINIRLSTLSTDGIIESPGRNFFTLDRLLQELRFVTADHIANGSTNKYFTRSNFYTLGITTNDIAEGDQLYFTPERVRSSMVGITSDIFTEGNTNLFVSSTNVRGALSGLTTADLNESPGRRYVSRDAFFELNISVGDILDSDALALKDEVTTQLSSASLHLENTFENALSVTSLHLENTFSNLNSATNLQLQSLEDTTSTQLLNLSLSVASLESSTNSDVLSVSVLVANSFNALTTAGVTETPFRRFVSQTAIEEANISSDSLIEGTNNKFASSDNVRAAIANGTTSDDLAQGQTNLYVTKQNVINTNLRPDELQNYQQTFEASFLSELQTINSDAITEGSTNLFFRDDRVVGALSTATTDQLAEGASNLYFSNERVLAVLSTATTDALPAGESNKYLTREGVLSLQMDVTDFVDSGAALLTPDNFRNLQITSDDLAQGQTNLYVTKQNVINTNLRPDELQNYQQTFEASFLSELQTINSDAITEGSTNLFFRDDRVVGALSTATTDQLAEGASNLYFSNERVLAVLSTATTDALPAGESNKYLTREGVLSLQMDVTDFVDSGAALLTPDNFRNLQITSDDLAQGSDNLFATVSNVRSILSLSSSDNLPEGEFNKYFSAQTANDWLTTKTADDLANGSQNIFFSATALASLLTKQHILETGLTATDINARSNDVTIATEELVESPSALFFTQSRFDNSLATKTTDDITEGAQLFHTSERVTEILSTTTTASLTTVLSLTFNTVTAQIEIPDDQILGGVVRIQLLQENLLMTTDVHAQANATTHTFSSNDLIPGDATITTTFFSRYATISESVNIVIPGTAPTLTSFNFTEGAAASNLHLNFTGEGRFTFELIVSTIVVHREDARLDHNVVVPLKTSFDEATVRITQGLFHESVHTITMPNSFVVRFPVETSNHYVTNCVVNDTGVDDTSIFSAFALTVVPTIGQSMDANRFHSFYRPNGNVTFLDSSRINFGTSGTMEITREMGATEFITFST